MNEKAPTRKQVLITGAGSGIGLETTISLLNRSHRVWATDREVDRLLELKHQFQNQLEIIRLDVTSTSDIDRAFEAIQQNTDSTEFALINNAGIPSVGPIEDFSMTEWQSIFSVNIIGVIQMTLRFLPLVRKSRGRIINVGSLQGRIGIPYYSPYSTSKFAVRGFNDCLRRELMGEKIPVILFEPGAITTPIRKINLERAARFRQTSTDPQKIKLWTRIESGIQHLATQAVSANRVANQMIHAVESPHPSPYYLIGRMTNLQIFLSKWLPTATLDRILTKKYIE